MEKIEKNLLYIILVLQIFNFFVSCSGNSKTKAVVKTQKETIAKVDSLQKQMNEVFNRTSNLETYLEIQNYKISKNILYDWNSVVRTKNRPDDLLIEYDKKIEKLEKELKNK